MAIDLSKELNYSYTMGKKLKIITDGVKLGSFMGLVAVIPTLFTNRTLDGITWAFIAFFIFGFLYSILDDIICPPPTS